MVNSVADHVGLLNLFRDSPEDMKTTIRYVIVAFVFALSGWNVQAKEPVDLVLVLAADVSRSIDTGKLTYSETDTPRNDARVVNAITSGVHGRIAACFVEWSGASSQRLVILDPDSCIGGPMTAYAVCMTLPKNAQPSA